MQNEVKQELGINFIEYAVACNTDRAIPDSKTGLKPVAKRILWSAYEEGRTSNKPHVKSARIVGDVMGGYHPHGNSSIYGAMVRLSQSWVMRYPLIDWHGNNGNIAGDGPAAERYTEARLSKIAELGLLEGIKKRNVDFIPNYSEDSEEPVTLPSIFPNLLCNPNMGIGVATACCWLPHNLNEVAQAIYDYLDGKEPILAGPDFPTGGIIINKNDIPQIMKTGHGSVKIRGQYNIENKKNIVFYEIPYGTTIENLLNEIGNACDKKEIEGISEIRDESNKNGIRIVIQCQKENEISSIINKLFEKTNLQSSISYNQVALIDKTPTELNLKDCIEIYINHNEECLIKEANFDLNKIESRIEIVTGLLKALENIDNIVNLIKKSSNSLIAKESLIKKYNFSENQAKAIIDMKLGRLAGLEKIELENEYKSLQDRKKDLTFVLTNKEKRLEIIKERLKNIVSIFGDPRRTQLTQLDLTSSLKEEKKTENVIVTITTNNEITRTATDSLKVQSKRGKGIKNKNQKPLLTTISTNTSESIFLFTSKGKMFRLEVDKISADSIENINSLIKLDDEEKVIAATTNKTNKYVVFVTKKGLIKKTAIEEYQSSRKNSGIIAIKFKDEDSLVNVHFMNEEEMIVLTKQGMIIHFETKNIKSIGRATSGVRGIKLIENDEVIAGLPIFKKDNNYFLVTFDKEGIVKKTSIDEYPLQNRDGKGLKYNTNGNELVCAVFATNTDKLLIIGDKRSMYISVEELSLGKRTNLGTKVIKDGIIETAIAVQ